MNDSHAPDVEGQKAFIKEHMRLFHVHTVDRQKQLKASEVRQAGDCPCRSGAVVVTEVDLSGCLG